MLDGKPSQSLVRTAIRRAAHQLLDSPLIFEDPIAVGLVPEASEQSIRANIAELSSPVQILNRGLFAFRSRFAEDRLAQAAARGVRQYVLVGAGLDTFPWRQPDFARVMQIFYVDHPASLTWTRACLRERGLPTPANLTYVDADLEKGELAARLAERGFKREALAYFSMLGVMQYISRHAIDALFGSIASLPRGSEITFSFAPPDDELRGADLESARNGVRVTKDLEPWLTRQRARELICDLQQLGFSDVFHLTPKDAHRHYFADRRDGLRAPAIEQMIAAIV